MTVSHQEPYRTGQWRPLPLEGFSAYEVCDRGSVRSINRKLPDGRQIKGRVLRTRPNNGGYLLVDLYDDQGTRKTLTMHQLVLLTFSPDPPKPGEEALHENDDPTDNRWPENLRWGTHPQNVADRMRNRPARPRPAKACVRCGDEFTGNGRRCHRCVVELGQEAARLLRAGARLDDVAEQLGYPSAGGLHTLAVRYGHYGQPWTRRVIARLVTLRHRRDSGTAGTTQREQRR